MLNYFIDYVDPTDEDRLSVHLITRKSDIADKALESL